MRAQASTEYIMIIGFVSFAILGVLVIAYTYANSASDSIKQSELENMIDKVISTSEYVFYSGTPAQATIIVYVPDGIRGLEWDPANKDIKVTYTSSSGTNIRSFSSNVDLALNLNISRFMTKGVKKLKILATGSGAEVSLA